MKNNMDVREAISKAGVRHWQVAMTIGVDETTLVRWLRTPLAPERKRLILTALAELENEKQFEGD